jgi:hypothetical protein
MQANALEPMSTLVHWLAGEFDNREQALNDPTWFVSLRLWHRPLGQSVGGVAAFFAEQANTVYLDQPYRQRVFRLEPSPNAEQWQVQYFAFKSPSQVQGAGQDPDRLRSLTLDDLELLPTCVLTLRQQGDRFLAEPKLGQLCSFQYNGQTRYVRLGFEVAANEFWSCDRGVDPETNQGLWGALMGPYHFKKIQNLA